MQRTLSLRTLSDYAYIDGQSLYDETSMLLIDILGSHCRGEVTISSKPFAGSKMAVLMLHREKRNIYKSDDGIFAVCSSKINTYDLGDHFHYKIKQNR